MGPLGLVLRIALEKCLQSWHPTAELTPQPAAQPTEDILNSSDPVGLSISILVFFPPAAPLSKRDTAVHTLQCKE